MKHFVCIIGCVAHFGMLNAQGILDRIILGDENSEKAHGFTSYCPDRVPAVVGLMDETGRACLRYEENPYAGTYKGIYGGEYQFVLKVDGSSQNYLTAKYSGDDTGFEIHYTADVDGKQLSNVSGSLVQYSETPKAPGAFLYRTYAIPRKETDGKTEVVVRIRSKGRYYQYGTPGRFETYQRVLDQDMPPLYALYTHSRPGFVVPEDEVQGNIPTYEGALPCPDANQNLPALKTAALSNVREKLVQILNEDYYDKNTAGKVLVLAAAYTMPQYPETFQADAVVEKIMWGLDNMARHHYDGSIPANSEWGGAFGFHGYALYKVRNEIPEGWLDQSVDLGDGTKTRREQYIDLLKTSFNHGATDRRTLSNQVAWASTPLYGASLGLYALDSVRFAEYPKIGLHVVREAAGLEDFTSAITGLDEEKPVMGDPSDVNGWCGAHYRMITSKGGGHEFPGWVCPGCYGYLWQNFIEMWDMMRHDPYLRGQQGAGDDFLQRIADYERLNASLSYPSVDARGYRAMLCHSVTCSRIVREPGYVYYGNISVAGLSGDHELLGHARQALEDGQQTWAEPDAGRVYGLYIPQAIDTLANHPECTEVLPFTDPWQEAIVSDEENAMVAFSYKGEIYYVSFAASMAQHISAQYTNAVGFVTDRTAFFDSGLIEEVQLEPYNSAHRVWFPERPLLAGGGEVISLPSYNHTVAVYNSRQPYKDFYQLWYGGFLIGMNTGLFDDSSYDILVPESLQGKIVYNLVTKEEIVLGSRVPVQAGTTCILHVGEMPGTSVEGEGSAVDADVSALSERVESLTAVLHSLADSVSLKGVNVLGHYPHDKFTSFWRELSFSAYAASCGTMLQQRCDSALAALEKAYEELLDSRYDANGKVDLPGDVDFTKAMKQGGQFVVSAGGLSVEMAQNGAYWMIPVQASEAGVYRITAHVRTTCDVSKSPKVNLTCLDPETASELAENDTHGDRKLLPGDCYSYEWNVYFKEGETKILKLSVSGNAYYVPVAEIESVSAALCGDSSGDYSWLFRVPEDNEEMQSVFDRQFTEELQGSPWRFWRYDTRSGLYTSFSRLDAESPKNSGIDAWYDRDEWLFINKDGYVHPLVEASPAIVFTAPVDGVYEAVSTVQRQSHKVDNHLYCRYRFLQGGLGENTSVPKENYMFDLAYGFLADNTPKSKMFYVNMKAGDAITFEIDAYTPNRISSGGTTWEHLAVSRLSDTSVAPLKEFFPELVYDIYGETGIGSVEMGKSGVGIGLRTVEGGIWVTSSGSAVLELYSVTGFLVERLELDGTKMFVSLRKGIYVVRDTNGNAFKFVVR